MESNENDKNEEDEYHSCASEDTEGPEEIQDYELNDSQLKEILFQLRQDDEKNWINELCQNNMSIHNERENARNLMKQLKNLISHLFTLRSCIEVDEQLQLFASSYCKGINNISK